MAFVLVTQTYKRLLKLKWGLQKLKWLIFDCCRKTNHLRYIWTDPVFIALLYIWLAIGALPHKSAAVLDLRPSMSNPTLFKLTKPTGGMRHTCFKSLAGFFCVLLKMTVHVLMVYDQTIDGRRNREQILGSYFVIEMIKLSYLGLLIVGLLQWVTDMYVSQNIKELLYRPSRIHS